MLGPGREAIETERAGKELGWIVAVILGIAVPYVLLAERVEKRVEHGDALALTAAERAAARSAEAAGPAREIAVVVDGDGAVAYRFEGRSLRAQDLDEVLEASGGRVILDVPDHAPWRAIEPLLLGCARRGVTPLIPEPARGGS